MFRQECQEPSGMSGGYIQMTELSVPNPDIPDCVRKYEIRFTSLYLFCRSITSASRARNQVCQDRS